MSLTNDDLEARLPSIRTVSDSGGNTTDTVSRKIAGTIQPDNNNPYAFYVQETTQSSTRGVSVNISLPVGGAMSGLYRFPRVGEKVIVQQIDGHWYLMAYVPSDGTDGVPFAPMDSSHTIITGEKDKLLDGQGMTLRYRQTGKIPDNAGPDEQYSEIGFYHNKTAWKPKTPGDYQDKIDDYPKVDTINIRSTGDIHSEAQNHHRTRAKRFELLVGDGEDFHIPDYSNGADNFTKDDFAFGDRPGDDPNLYAGDAHIRAKHRIVIKAGDEIRLEVGRSAIIITDSGITIETRKLKSTKTAWDTVIALTPIGGIDIFGHHVKIKSALDFSLGDSYGGELSSILGVTRIISKDFKAQSSALAGYMTTGIGTLVSYGELIFSLANGYLENPLVYPKGLSKAPGGLATLINVLTGYMDADGTEGSDFTYNLCKALRIISLVTNLIPLVVENVIAKENIEKIGGMDMINTAVSAVDLATCAGTFIYVCTNLFRMIVSDAAGNGAVITPYDTSFLHLTGSAGFVLDGRTHKESGATVVDVSTPFALAPEKPKEPNSYNWKEAVKKALLGMVLGGVAGDLAALSSKTRESLSVPIGGMMDNLGLNQKRLNELKEL